MTHQGAHPKEEGFHHEAHEEEKRGGTEARKDREELFLECGGSTPLSPGMPSEAASRLVKREIWQKRIWKRESQELR